MGKSPFSPALKKAGQKIELWKAVLTTKKGCKYSASKMKLLAQAAGVQNPMQRTIKQAELELKNAQLEHKNVKKMQGSYGQNFWKSEQRKCQRNVIRLKRPSISN